MLKLYNVRMKQSSVRKKIRGTTQCDKKTITCDIRNVQYEDETVKCEKKRVRKPLNVTKELSHVILEPHNVMMKLLSVRKK